ncbi:MAG TPA: hypothetical protein VLJ68_13485 [Chitinophagaceae bacterium]|nr:hypothetical protein [Chitinophagaceae bacterium]
MKKILIPCLLILGISMTASAQLTPGGRFQRNRISGQVTRMERTHLRNDVARYHLAQRNAHRDGFVSPMERRRLQKMKKRDRRELYFIRHNRRHRVI